MKKEVIRLFFNASSRVLINHFENRVFEKSKSILLHPQLVKNIAQHIQLNPMEWQQMSTYWVEKKISKGDYLLRNGEVCKTDNYVVSGGLKAYYLHPEKGTEEILYFAIEDWWATDLLSFQKQEPSQYNIQAIEDTTVLQITRHGFHQMLRDIPKLERYFRIILESYVGSLQQRIMSIHAYDITHQYREFIERYPKISQRIPQYLLASYLGVTPEFLSRLKNKI